MLEQTCSCKWAKENKILEKLYLISGCYLSWHMQQPDIFSATGWWTPLPHCIVLIGKHRTNYPVQWLRSSRSRPGISILIFHDRLMEYEAGSNVLTTLTTQFWKFLEASPQLYWQLQRFNQSSSIRLVMQRAWWDFGFNHTYQLPSIQRIEPRFQYWART